LLPGFLFIKIISLRCSIREYEVHHYIVDSLLSSLVIYLIVSLIPIKIELSSGVSIALVIGVTILLSLICSVILNRDWLAKLLHPGDTHLSTHSSIFPVKGIKEFKGKWHLIRFSDGKEIVGVLREFNHDTHEALIEKARLIVGKGNLSSESAWYYVPSGEQIIYMRTIEENKSE
jgi:hypothetical protein